MLINPKKLLRRERQLKAVIGMGGKEFKILHKQFDEIYNKIQQKKLRKRAIGGGRQGVIKDTKSKLLFILMYGRQWVKRRRLMNEDVFSQNFKSMMI